MNNQQKLPARLHFDQQMETQPLQATTKIDFNANQQITDVVAPEVEEVRKPNVCQRLCGCQLEFCREVVSECRQVDCSGVLKRTFSLKTLKRRLPIIKWLPKYRLQYLQGDIIAGITVGLTIIPQSLAYAKIAELPPQYGLYTAFMAGFVYCIFGTSKDANLGPAAIMSLLTAEFGRSMVEGDATYAVALSLVSGVIQIAMGFLHIGFLVEYISHPVINSFTTAAAITISCSQLKKWLGLHGIPRGFIPQITTVLRKLPQTHLPDFGLGVGCMVLLYLLKKLKDVKVKGDGDSRLILRRVVNKVIFITGTARNAIIVIFSAGLAAILYNNNQVPFTLTGNITSGIPPFRPPKFSGSFDNQTFTAKDIFATMGLGTIMVPVVGVIEVIAVGKAFGRKNGYNVEANQELLATGFSNLFGSFVSAYPVTASFSRSAVNSQSGCATPLAGVINGAMVLLALAVLTPLFFYIPDAALAAVIIMAIVEMIDFSMLKHLWHISRPDLLPWFTTFFVSLGAGFEFGILLGVATSLLILLYPWARPPLTITQYEDSNVEKATDDDDIKPADILLLNVSMGLMFPGIEHLQETIAKKAFRKDGASSVIVDFSSVHRLDYTSALGIEQLMEDFVKHETWLVFIHVQCGVLDTLERAEVTITHEETLEDALDLIRTRRPPDDTLSNLVVVPPSTNGHAPTNTSVTVDQTGWSVIDVSTHCLAQRRRSRSDSNASHAFKLSLD